MATATAIELLAAYRVAIARVTGPNVDTPIPDLAALGIVRFAAPSLNGTVILGVSSSTLRRSNSRGTTNRDWVAELANQFIGRFKLKLLRGGFEIGSMTPVAVSERILLAAMSQPKFAPIAFRDPDGGSLAVWIDMEISGPLKIAIPALPGEIPCEGEVILF